MCGTSYLLAKMSNLVDVMERSPTWSVVLCNQGPALRQPGSRPSFFPYWLCPLGQVLLTLGFLTYKTAHLIEVFEDQMKCHDVYKHLVWLLILLGFSFSTHLEPLFQHPSGYRKESTHLFIFTGQTIS